MVDGIRVLYVDDEPGLLEIGKLFLEENGEFSVDTVLSASDALEILTKNTYDAIVSDYRMPKMDGIEFLKRVRAFNKIIPFILFTGKGREEVVIEAINNGVDFYLQKGADIEAQFAELAHKIRQAVLMRRTQMTIAEQEQRYHDIQNASDLIQSVTPNGHFLFVNKKWLDTLGYTEEELSHLTIFDIIHEESQKHCMEIFQRVIDGENVGIIDAVFRTRDGRKVYVEGMANCRIVDGVCQYTRGLFKDVTERKQAEAELLRKNEDLNAAYEELTATEEELRQNYEELSRKDEILHASEEKFRALVELSLDGIIITDFTGKLLFANKAAGLIVDAPDYEAMIGKKNVIEFVAPESKAKVLWDFGQVALGIDTYLVNYKLITATKREVWVECIGKKIAFEGSTAMMVSLRDVTERKLADERLRASENKFFTVFQNSPVALTLVSTTDKKFVDVNDAFTRSTGYSRDEVIGKTAEELEIFSDRQEFEQLTATLQEKHIINGMELKCRQKNGDIRTCLFSCGVLMMGNTPHVLSSVEDVTERKLAEERLRQSEEKYRSLVETTPDMIWELDLQGKFRYVSSGVTRIMGYTPEELIRRQMADLVPEQYRSSVMKELSAYISSEGPLAHFEACALHRDGHEMVIEIRPSRITGADGSLQGFRGVARDITERRAAEEALRQSEEKFRSFVENASEIIYSMTPDGIFTYISPQYTELIGYDPSEVLGHSFESILPPDDVPQLRKYLQQVLAGDKNKAGIEFRIRHKDGNLQWHNITASVIRDAGGNVVSLLGISRDITERKRAEEALRQANRKLSILSGITRHDIRNQLMALDGFVALVEKKIQNPAFEHQFSRIRDASSRITSMIQFTKEYEKIGLQAPAWQDIRSLVDTADRDAARDQIALINDLPAGAEVFADLLISRVFFNLIDNAVRHGGKITTIRFSLEVWEGDRIIVCEDDGEGVPAKEKATIFEMGYGKNTGFGLAFSRDILDITGISIRENGIPKKGARFEITVPKSQFRSVS